MYVNEYIKDTKRIKNHEDREGFIRLDMNENPEGLPDEFFYKIINKITPELIARYPQKDSLIKLIAEKEEIRTDNISLLNGSDEGIRLVFETYTKPGSEVISVSPTFEMYKVYCNMFGVNNISIEYDEKFNISVERVIDSINENTTLVALLNPNSPIGNIYTDCELDLIINKAQQFGATVLIDEAYYYFGASSTISYIKKYKNVLVLRTFSKLCSIAGLRIGFIAGDAELINNIENTQLTYNVNSIAILFAEQLMLDDKIITQLIQVEKEGKEYLVKQLKEDRYEYYAQNGNYILVKSKRSPIYIFEELKKRGILIKTYNTPILKEWIRVTTASTKVMMRFWEIFRELDHDKDEIRNERE